MAGEQLWVIEGRERSKRLSVDAGLLIGRAAPEDDGRLGGDPEISRGHARVSGLRTGHLLTTSASTYRGHSRSVTS
jgi:hypothetical protein